MAITVAALTAAVTTKHVMVWLATEGLKSTRRRRMHARQNARMATEVVVTGAATVTETEDTCKIRLNVIYMPPFIMTLYANNSYGFVMKKEVITPRKFVVYYQCYML